MIEYIQSQGKDIAIFVPGHFTPEQTRFITKNAEPMQWGIGVFKKGAKVEPHRHMGVPATVSEFQEFIMIRQGRVVAEVFDEAGELVRKIEMVAGDALLLLRGGHGFEFLENAELLELKQGPYLGREKMKAPLRPSDPQKAHSTPNVSSEPLNA